MSRPTTAPPQILLDTSVAVAVCVADHVGHASAIAAIGDRRVGLAGHAWFETFSVLTRLPPPQRRGPSDVLVMMRENFPSNVFASGEAQQGLIDGLESVEIAGGAIYDALVALAARESALVLLSSDRRAMSTYATIGADVESVEW